MTVESTQLRVCITAVSSEDVSFDERAQHIGRIVRIDLPSLHEWKDGFYSFVCFDDRSGRRLVYHKVKYRTLAKGEGFGPRKVEGTRFPDTMYKPTLGLKQALIPNPSFIDVVSLMLIHLGGWVVLTGIVAAFYHLALWLF